MITGILLAAGQSSRFGSDKLLHAYSGGTPIAVAALRNFRPALDHVIAVVRAGAGELSARLSVEGARVIVCADAYSGMGNSLASGVRAAQNADGWVIALADMPCIRADTVIAVANALRAGERVAVPIFNGKRGHPVGFAAELYNDLATLSGDIGAKALLARHEARFLDCKDPGVLFDVDTRADLSNSEFLGDVRALGELQ
jgi:molybdenum cofactor cytidylyltransferase